VSQQINLFDQRFRRERPRFSAATMVLVLGGLSALIVAAGEFLATQNRSLQSTLAQTDRRLTEMREQTLRFAKQLGAQGPSGALADEAARVEAELRARHALLAGLQSGPTGGERFSPYLTALAQRTMPGVWLTAVELGPNGLVLRGRVLDGDLVPAYIRSLNREPLFHGRIVSELKLSAKTEAGKPEARHVEFSLRIPLGGGAA